ncbi:ABC transporter permease, partial [Pseudactinotalea sp.]|uniref:ABC transporter permease n=1 Tax=Pseudactinotalea sp. TaxID=1926260 RepID=UPI003B3B8D55
MTLAQRGGADEPSELARLAARHGLTKVGSRPGLGQYIKTLWSRRAFLWVMASSRSYSRNQNNFLGQLWTVLSPLTLAGVYFLVFGVILNTRGGTDNYVGFLTIGIFIFTSISAAITAGSTAITSNISVVRALDFPRVVLPL